MSPSHFQFWNKANSTLFSNFAKLCYRKKKKLKSKTHIPDVPRHPLDHSPHFSLQHYSSSCDLTLSTWPFLHPSGIYTTIRGDISSIYRHHGGLIKVPAETSRTLGQYVAEGFKCGPQLGPHSARRGKPLGRQGFFDYSPALPFPYGKIGEVPRFFFPRRDFPIKIMTKKTRQNKTFLKILFKVLRFLRFFKVIFWQG